MKLLLSLGLVLATLAGSFINPAHAAKSEINVLLFGMPYTRGLQALAADFQAETGIKANIEVIGQKVFENRITLEFTGNTNKIDVVHTPVIQVQRWIKAGWVQPITSRVNNIQDKADILAGPLDAYKVNGEYWAVPYMAAVGMMTYRKDILKAAGKKFPQTFEEMIDVAKAVHSKDVAAVALRAAPGQGFNMFIFPMIMRAYGGKFFADYPGGDLTPAINSPETLKALRVYMTLLNNYGPPGAGNFNFPEVRAGVINGKIAMTLEGTGIVNAITSPAKSKFADRQGVALPPAGPAGRSPAIAVHGLGIPKGASDPETSFKFIEWATSEKIISKIAMAEPFADFVRAKVAKNPDVAKKYASLHPDLMPTRLKALDVAIGHYRPLIPEWPALGQAIGENINAALNGLVSPENALKGAEQEMKEILGK